MNRNRTGRSARIIYIGEISMVAMLIEPCLINQSINTAEPSPKRDRAMSDANQ